MLPFWMRMPPPLPVSSTPLEIVKLEIETVEIVVSPIVRIR